MKPNTPAQIATGTALILRYGSWSAVREASVRVPGGVFVVRRKK